MIDETDVVMANEETRMAEAKDKENAISLVSTVKGLKKAAGGKQSRIGVRGVNEEANDGAADWSALRAQLEQPFGKGSSEHSGASLLSPYKRDIYSLDAQMVASKAQL
ncbi:hypothetical protein GCK32_018345 [Trichostrongylus colubriformis]|uniref:Uncharacterized protein n=1 Tax=Trichostrongylus colubriformis TaxID=6319 RepID=A0AAN8IAB9_TRICO